MAPWAEGRLVCTTCVVLLLGFEVAQPAAFFLAGHKDASRLATVGEKCSYDVPALQSSDDEGAMRFIENGYASSIGRDEAITGLADTEVRSAASEAGPRWRKGCVKDADGNCKEATCPEDTYGEITLHGITELFRDPHVNLQSNDVFADLGSGLGRAVASATFVSGVHEAFGVELSERRWNLGCQALGTLASGIKGSVKSSQVSATHQHFEMRHENILDADLQKPTVVYIASLCFRKALMSKIQYRLEQQLPSGARVASLRRFPEQRQNGQVGLKFRSMTRVMMDWNDPTDLQPVFLYSMERGHNSSSTHSSLHRR
eukprot:gnl/MRDRNA2_/MRDRNA2_91603_c0_seq1.p1 gnl/MRDRNA2_/MRDRNA2_91603_c0~~gnl/MRDRNA2_/MRDRNA2_91603_c0_seq1.p1  ORF type:complete len:316 (-),score=63.75 gnl/MRDRNA2_/MRDRNA2_91603_c0_seq1:16-963(-)